MKSIRFVSLPVIVLVMAAGAVGCRTNPQNVSRIPPPPKPEVAEQTGDLPNVTSQDGTNLMNSMTALGPGHPGWPKNTTKLAPYTVHFDLDSSAVKASEKSKVASVADYLKANAAEAVEVDGHCDERGTEEYNRALGERRALALREQLIALGIASDRVDTLSYGEDKPEATGHSEDAWKRNRRGEFILLIPPK